MNSISFTKKYTVFCLLLVFVVVLLSPLKIKAQQTPLESNFEINLENNRISVTSPIYNYNSNLKMIINASLLPGNSNPYINLSYFDDKSSKIVFSTVYIFQSLFEYSDSNQILQQYNIGRDNSFGTNLAMRGYKQINYTLNTFQNQNLHCFTLETLDDVFTLKLNIPEGIIYPNNIEVGVPGFFIDITVNNFPYNNENNKLAMMMVMVSSSTVTIDVIENDTIFTYEDFTTGLNSTFYTTNSYISNIESDLLTLQERVINFNINFQNSSKNIFWNGYVGQINTNPILPDTTDNIKNNGIIGILDFTVKADFIDLELSGEDLAYISFSIASITGLLFALYYFIKKYFIYISGFLIALTVSIYLPSRKVTAIQALHHDKRREIMDALYESAENGLMMKKLKEIVQLPQTTLLWHLSILEEFQFVTRIKIHKQIIIISNDFLEGFDPRIKELELSFLSEQGELFRSFISSFKADITFSVDKIIDVTGWHRKTAKRHLKRLANLGIIKFQKDLKTFIITPEFKTYFFED
jgi:predicted transcriptional regulator